MRVLLVLVLFTVTACGGADGADGPSTTSLLTTTSMATIPSTTSTIPDTTTSTTRDTTSTTSTPVEADWPDYYVFGMDGLAMSVDGQAVHLFDLQIWNAASDFNGGVVFESVSPEGSPVLYWLKEGADALVEIDNVQNPLDSMTALVDDSPAIVGTEPTDLEDIEQTLRMVSFDLATAAVTTYPAGFGFEGDAGGLRPSSVGDHLVVGTSSATVGSLATSQSIVFWDLDSADELTDLPNPFPDTCEPCELDVRLSPDGGRLAYWHRPDAKWPEDWANAADMDSLTWEEWWADSSEIPGTVVVLDLQTGAPDFEAEESAGWRLSGFDGRYVVLHTSGPDQDAGSMIIDTRDGREQRVDGLVALKMTVSGE